MSCLNPIQVVVCKDTPLEKVVKVRCRTCEDCKQSYRSAAFIRQTFEFENCIKQGGFVLFFTLTFADEWVPFKFHRMCFDKKLVQDWLQKLRQELRRKYGYRVKYFIVSELGHVGTHRPHHHGTLYFYKDDKYQLKSWKVGNNRFKIPFFPASYCRIIKDLWQYGRCDVQEFDNSKGGFQYIAKYVAKGDEEEKLFSDIITRIQIKRKKGIDPSYYDKVFPTIFKFRQRYCAFNMISNDFGLSSKITDKKIEDNDTISIAGYNYSIPRYFSDRYIRMEIKACQELYSDRDFKGKFNFSQPTYYNPYYRHFWHLDTPNYCVPPERTLIKHISKVFDNQFDYHYELLDCPLYTEKIKYDGTKYKVQVLPKQSEVSQLSRIREEKKKQNILSWIETQYYNLPSLLQNSCNFDVPKLLLDTKALNLKDFMLTDIGVALVLELEELNQVASEWRARSRISKMEQKRKEKTAMNQRFARPLLSWNTYREKSHYFNMFNKKIKSL